jgi:Uncharacterized protein conserved in archaea
MEATHHGPTYQNVPVIFVEIGSDKTYWTNERIVRTLVDSTLKGIDKVDETDCRDYISGFGGPHYSKLFTKLADESCIGHVISKHYVDKLDDKVIIQAIANSVNNINKVVIDSLNLKQRERIIAALKSFDIHIQLR